MKLEHWKTELRYHSSIVRYRYRGATSNHRIIRQKENAKNKRLSHQHYKLNKHIRSCFTRLFAELSLYVRLASY